jgi:hypothetical protein
MKELDCGEGELIRFDTGAGFTYATKRMQTERRKPRLRLARIGFILNSGDGRYSNLARVFSVFNPLVENMASLLYLTSFLLKAEVVQVMFLI